MTRPPRPARSRRRGRGAAARARSSRDVTSRRGVATRPAGARVVPRDTGARRSHGDASPKSPARARRVSGSNEPSRVRRGARDAFVFFRRARGDARRRGAVVGARRTLSRARRFAWILAKYRQVGKWDVRADARRGRPIATSRRDGAATIDAVTARAVTIDARIPRAKADGCANRGGARRGRDGRASTRRRRFLALRG